MNAGGHVKFTLGKEMIPDNFKGADRVKFSDWEFEMSNFFERWRLRARGRHLGVDHATAGWRARVRRDRSAAGMDRTSKRPHEVCEVPVHGAEQSSVRNAASIGEKRTTQRWSERLETTAHGVRASDQCDGARIHEEIAGNLSSENTSEVSSALQKLKELVRKYEEYRD